jgi:hypothetical protein
LKDSDWGRTRIVMIGSEKQLSTMRWVLFWIFAILFVLIVIATLAMIFFDFGNPQPEERRLLFKIFIGETGLAVIALFYAIFGLKTGKKSLVSSENEVTSDGYISNRQKAFEQIDKTIEEIKQSDAPLTIKVIGQRGRHIVNEWLDSFIAQNKHQSWLSNIDFEYYLLDKQFAASLEGMENNLSDIESSIKRLDVLSKEFNTDMAAKKISIKKYLFSYVNPFQAFLIGDNHLFLSFFIPKIVSGKVIKWTGPASSIYYYYNKDIEKDRFMFDVVEGWLEFYGRSGPS